MEVVASKNLSRATSTLEKSVVGNTVEANRSATKRALRFESSDAHKTTPAVRVTPFYEVTLEAWSYLLSIASPNKRAARCMQLDVLNSRNYTCVITGRNPQR